MKANLVGTVIILSLIIWIPVSCCVSYQDRKLKRKEEEENKWLSATVSSLIHLCELFDVDCRKRESYNIWIWLSFVLQNTKLIRPEHKNNIRTSRKTYNRQAYRTPRITLTQDYNRPTATFTWWKRLVPGSSCVLFPTHCHAHERYYRAFPPFYRRETNSVDNLAYPQICSVSQLATAQAAAQIFSHLGEIDSPEVIPLNGAENHVHQRF